MGHSLESLATGSTTCSLDTGQRQATNSRLQLKTRTLKPLLPRTKISPPMTGAKQPVMKLMLPVGLWWENTPGDAIGEGTERFATLNMCTIRPIITGTPDIWTSPFSRIGRPTTPFRILTGGTRSRGISARVPQAADL